MSETFSNKNDGGPDIWVHLAQKDESGTEMIAALTIPVPPSPDDSFEIVVTLMISAEKMLTVETTVVRNAPVREFGPFPVE